MGLKNWSPQHYAHYYVQMNAEILSSSGCKQYSTIPQNQCNQPNSSNKPFQVN